MQTSVVNAPTPATASDTRTTARRNPIVAALNQMMVSVLGEQVREMFDRADDVLFDSAEKAQAAEEQRLYMDTMRTLRLQRTRIMDHFSGALDDALSRIDDDSAEQETADDISQWSLQDGDALEERLAVSNMEVKAAAMHAHELGELKRRLASLSLLVSDSISEEAMSPGRIVRAFQGSMKDLTVDFPIKLVIYKLFDRVVLSRLSELFTGANQLLALNGVEPAEAPESQRATRTRRSDMRYAPSQGVPAWASQLDPATLGAFGASGQGANGAHGAVPGYLPGAANGQAMPTGWAAPVPGMPGDVSDATLAHEVGRILHGYREGRRPDSPAWLPPESVALVARMFDRYYRDSRMPDSLKPMLAKLQLPMVKAAIGDQGFFANAEHPARRVINDLFDLMLRFGAADSGDKQTALAELHALIDTFAASVRLDPERLRQAPPSAGVDGETAETFIREQGELQHQKNGMQIERVRRLVAHELRRHVGERRLAPGVMRLLLSGFGPILSVDYIRGGTDSASWRESIRLVDRVIDSLEHRPADPEQRHRDEAEIVSAVSNRLARVGFSDERMSDVIAGLLDAYRDSEEAAAGSTGVGATAPEEASAGEESARLSPEKELQSLLTILLIPNTWFTLVDRRTATKHWVRVKTYHPAQNAVLFSHYMEPRFVRWHATSVASGLVDGGVSLIDPSPELHAAVTRLGQIPFERTHDGVDWIGADGLPVSDRSH